MSETGNNFLIGKQPNFDGNNYFYWKTRMRIYIQSISERVWMSTMEDGWKSAIKVTDGVNEA